MVQKVTLANHFKTCYHHTMNTIDLEQFEKAIISLHKILERYEREKEDIDIRDAVIKRFEYTYSTAVRIIMRYLSYTSPESDDILSFNEAIRRANQAGILLTNLEKWSEFRKNRNITSHLYDEEAIESIINIIPEFIKDVDFLLMELKKRL